MKNKSTLEEIEARFDQDVARFSNLDTGAADYAGCEIQYGTNNPKHRNMLSGFELCAGYRLRSR